MEKLNLSGKKQEVNTDFYADTMEHEKVSKAFGDMNREKGIFVNQFEDGLNRNRGIFDSTAVFKTK